MGEILTCQQILLCCQIGSAVFSVGERKAPFGVSFAAVPMFGMHTKDILHSEGTGKSPEKANLGLSLLNHSLLTREITVKENV